MKHPDEVTLSTYIDNELSIWKKLVIQHHIKSCNICKKTVKDFQKIKIQLSTTRVEFVNDDIWKRIENRLEATGTFVPQQNPIEKFVPFILIFFAFIIGYFLINKLQSVDVTSIVEKMKSLQNYMYAFLFIQYAGIYFLMIIFTLLRKKYQNGYIAVKKGV